MWSSLALLDPVRAVAIGLVTGIHDDLPGALLPGAPKPDFIADDRWAAPSPIRCWRLRL